MPDKYDMWTLEERELVKQISNTLVGGSRVFQDSISKDHWDEFLDLHMAHYLAANEIMKRSGPFAAPYNCVVAMCLGSMIEIFLGNHPEIVADLYKRNQDAVDGMLSELEKS